MTNEQMNGPKDTCDCKVAFVTEKIIKHYHHSYKISANFKFPLNYFKTFRAFRFIAISIQSVQWFKSSMYTFPSKIPDEFQDTIK